MITKYVHESKEDVIDVPQLHFELNKYYDIHTKLNNVKKFQFTFDKREIDVKHISEYEINTLPFGYKNFYYV